MPTFFWVCGVTQHQKWSSNGTSKCSDISFHVIYLVLAIVNMESLELFRGNCALSCFFISVDEMKRLKHVMNINRWWTFSWNMMKYIIILQTHEASGVRFMPQGTHLIRPTMKLEKFLDLEGRDFDKRQMPLSILRYNICCRTRYVAV